MAKFIKVRAAIESESITEAREAQNDRDPMDIVAVKLGRGEGKDMLQREAKILYQLRGYGTGPVGIVSS